MALIRRATVPGTGDPSGFRLGDYSSQRNLSEAGRQQAAELGRKLRAAGVLVTQVRSSLWCRALHTAEFAFRNVPITAYAALDSILEEPGRRQEQTEQARALVSSWQWRQGTLALVTHQVNITALTGVFLAEEEIVVLQPIDAAAIRVVGRVKL